MLFSEIGPDTLNRELNRFLADSKLSLSQVARKLGVSKGHLSEIKNGKAAPALNTGLRILKICGLEVEKRRAWAHFYNTSISEEYLEVHDGFKKENIRKLNERVSFLLARDLDLMNAYIDIVNSEEEGILLEDLRLDYGRSIEKRLEKLCAQDVITVRNDVHGKIYQTGKVDPIITRYASYDLIRTVVTDQQTQYQSGQFGEDKGKFKFHINDVDTEGYEKLKNLFEETFTQAEKIMGQHRQNRREGGERYAFEMLLGRLKSIFIIIFLLSSFIASEPSRAQSSGGLSGGNSEQLESANLSLENATWEELKEHEDIEINWPTISFQGIEISLNNICHSQLDNEIKAITQEGDTFSQSYYNNFTLDIEVLGYLRKSSGVEVISLGRKAYTIPPCE